MLEGGVAAIGGTTEKAKGKFTTDGLSASTASPEGALEASTILVEDLEEKRRRPVVLEVDGMASLRAVGAGDRAPPPGHEDIAGVDHLDFHLQSLAASSIMPQP